MVGKVLRIWRRSICNFERYRGKTRRRVKIAPSPPVCVAGLETSREAARGLCWHLPWRRYLRGRASSPVAAGLGDGGWGAELDTLSATRVTMVPEGIWAALRLSAMRVSSAKPVDIRGLRYMFSACRWTKLGPITLGNFPCQKI